MNAHPYILRLSIFLVGLAAFQACFKKRTEPTLTMADKCNVQGAYVFRDGECIFKNSLANQRAECLEKNDGSSWMNEHCASPEEINGLQKTCNEQPDHQWGIDPETKVLACLGQIQILNAKNECLDKKDGSIWSQDNQCLTPEGQQCIKSGNVWSISLKCISHQENDCNSQVNGSRWIQDHCATADEQRCLELGKLRAWDKTLNSCRLRNFLDYCLDPIAPSDIKATVAALKELAYNLDDCHAAFKQLSEMNSLLLANKQLSNLQPLVGLAKVTEVYLQNNAIIDILALSELKGLTFLDLSHNQIENIAPLKQLSSLSALFLSENNITDASALADLHKLKTLHLTHNRLSSLNNLSNQQSLVSGSMLHSLVNLDISDNCELSDISSITPFFTSLNNLNINRTKIDRSKLPSRLQGILNTETEEVCP